MDEKVKVLMILMDVEGCNECGMECDEPSNHNVHWYTVFSG